jgi:hypothetical protein
MKQLLESLQRIDEAGPAPAPVAATAAAPDEEARFAAYNKKQEDSKAQAALVTKLQGMLLKRDDPNTASKGYFIDPTNGLIGYASPYGGGKQNGGGDGRPEMLRFDQVDTGIHKAVKQLLTSAGLTVVSSKNIPGILNYFGGYASIPMDQVKMIQSGKLPNQAQPAVAAQPAATSVASAAPAVAAPVNTQYPAAPTNGTGASIDQQAQQGALVNPSQQGDFATGYFGSIEKVRLSLDGVKKLTGLKENIIFKSLIGRALLETDSLLTESDLDQLNKFWPNLVKWASVPANANFPEAQEIERLREPITKWQASQQQSTIDGNSAAVRDRANASTQPEEEHQQGAIVNAPVTGSAALNPANGGADTTIASGPETAAGGAGVVPAPEKKTIPDAQAVTAAGNHVPTGTDAQNYAAVNHTTGAMYNADTIGPGSKDSGTDHRVAELQKRLGINPATGVYGTAEKKAVEALQQKYGITVDGKYGPDTKAAFEKEKQTYVAPSPNGDKKGAGDQPVIPGGNSSFPTNAADSVNPRPTNPLQAQAWDAKYGNGWNPDGSSKNSGTGDQPQSKDPSRPGLDPKGKPDVYDKQKQLAELGAKNKDGTKLKTDGVRGNDTIKAEKEFGYLIIDPKTTISVNGTVRPVNPADIKNIPTWIKAVKEKRKTIEEVPLVYMDVVKKQLSMKESYNTNGQLMYNEDQTLARIIQLSR